MSLLDLTTSCYIVDNAGDYSIFILSAKTIPDVFFLSRDKDIHSIIEDQLSGITYWPIEPKGTAEFVIADRFKDGKKARLPISAFFVPVSWRRGSMTWLPNSCYRPNYNVTRRTDADVIIGSLK